MKLCTGTIRKITLVHYCIGMVLVLAGVTTMVHAQPLQNKNTLNFVSLIGQEVKIKINTWKFSGSQSEYLTYPDELESRQKIQNCFVQGTVVSPFFWAGGIVVVAVIAFVGRELYHTIRKAMDHIFVENQQPPPPKNMIAVVKKHLQNDAE